MDPQYWGRLKAEFHRIHDASAAERDAALARLRREQPRLCTDLEALLAEAAHVASESWWPIGRTADRVDDFHGTDRFELVERIGAGGFGLVYRAYDHKEERTLALKVLRAHSPDSLLQFKQEFRSVADLRHPNLVTVHELIIEPQHAFFTMELIEGTPITHQFGRFTRRPALAPETTERIRSAFGQLMEGVLALHRIGILHRDLKPSNVICTREGRVVVLDFGLAEGIARACLQVWGTPDYMAPELFQAAPASPQSDWYSFGVLLFECLTGVHPKALVERMRPAPSGVVGPTATERHVLAAVQRLDVAPRPSDYVSGVPEDLDGLCGALLHSDPKQRPSVEAIVRVLGSEHGTHDTRSSVRCLRLGAPLHRGPLVGRGAQMDALWQCFARTRNGRLVVARVQGRSGLGKSALVNAFLEQLQTAANDALVLNGRCHERETLGYRVFDGVVDDLVHYLCRLRPSAVREWLPEHSAELATLFPAFAAVCAHAAVASVPLETTSPSQARLLAFAALRELLLRVSKQFPIVVFVDDLQWGDTDSEPLLRHLLRRSELPLLLIVAYRSEDLGSQRLDALLAALGTAGDLVDVPVEPLGSTDVRLMLEHQLGTAHPLIPVVLASREGAPFLLELLVDEFKQPMLQDSWPSSGGLTLEILIERTVARLTPSARRLLALLAIGARPLPRRLAYAALGLSRQAARDAEETLQLKRLVRLGPEETLETFHDRVRTSVTTALDARARRDMHAALLEALPSGSDPEALAYHALGSENTELARTYCLEAGKQCEGALAFDRAAAHYRRALALGIRPKNAEVEVLVRLADVLVHAGHGHEAAAYYLQAAAEAPEARFELELAAGQQLMHTGEVVAGQQMLTKLLRSRGVDVPRTRFLLGLKALFLRARLHLARLPCDVGSRMLSDDDRRILDTLWALASSLALVDTLGSMYFQMRHLAVAMRVGDATTLGRALSLEAVFACIEGAWSQRRTAALLEQVERCIHGSERPEAEALLHLAKAIVAWMQADFQRCYAMTAQCERQLRFGRGRSFELATNRAFALASLIWLGRLNQHAARFDSLLEDARLRSDLHAESSLVLLAHAHVQWLAQDAPERARDAVWRVCNAWPVQRDFTLQHAWAAFSLTEIDLYQGRADEAMLTLTRAWHRLRHSAHLRIAPIRIWMLQLRARVALAALAALGAQPRRTNPKANPITSSYGRTLLRRVESLVRRLRREELPLGRALAALTAGLVAMHKGELDSARNALQRAIDGFAALDMRIHLAAAHWARATLEVDPELRTLEHVAAERRLREIGFVRPERLVAMLLPNLHRAPSQHVTAAVIVQTEAAERVDPDSCAETSHAREPP